jgi:hypothetical protein
MRLPVIAAGGLLLFMGYLMAHASTQSCDRPPFGMTVGGFKAAVNDLLEPLGLVPTKVLPPLCRANFEGGDRTPLYNLGLTDHEIDSEPMDDLLVDFLKALRQFAQSVR